MTFLIRRTRSKRASFEKIVCLHNQFKNVRPVIRVAFSLFHTFRKCGVNSHTFIYPSECPMQVNAFFITFCPACRMGLLNLQKFTTQFAAAKSRRCTVGGAPQYSKLFSNTSTRCNEFARSKPSRRRHYAVQHD